MHIHSLKEVLDLILVQLLEVFAIGTNSGNSNQLEYSINHGNSNIVIAQELYVPVKIPKS
jgi:hypothetical protein